jgi:phosphoserine aminotransferase
MTAKRVFNFSAGPAMLPIEVLEASAQALVDYKGKGFGIAECSHRGKEFDEVLDQAIALCRKLLDIPESHDVLFLQGGATQLFSTIPMNFLNGTAEYVVGGEWSKKAADAAKGAHGDKIKVIGTSEATHFDRPPSFTADPGRLVPARVQQRDGARPPAAGMAQPSQPDRRFLERDDVPPPPHRPHGDGLRRGAEEPGAVGHGAGHRAQGSLRPHPQERAEDLQLQGAGRGQELPEHAPTFGVYMLLETFRWMEKQGGLAAIEKVNAQKAQLIYDAVDGSGGYYTGTVADKGARSHMNVTFRLPSEELTDKFVKEASGKGMVALKGYRTVGGIRASIYNAMPIEGCQALAEHMKAFQKSNG